ncbi:MAG TPA: hypothetical protein VFM14_12020 [Gemmatimonadales bacterium]|nr:hypothetical protein [Gemmatimonadales bacterium]
MRRRIQPIPAAMPFRQLSRHLRSGETLGVWIGAEGRSRPSAVYRSASFVVSADLGALLGRVERVLVWGGSGLRALALGRCRTG